jgi:hypothetical protein
VLRLPSLRPPEPCQDSVKVFGTFGVVSNARSLAKRRRRDRREVHGCHAEEIPTKKATSYHLQPDLLFERSAAGW